MTESYAGLFSIIFGYILGSINPSYLIAKMRGFDIRKRGSGNAGASNAMITMGKWVGIFTALFDIAKAFIAYKMGETLFVGAEYARELCVTACVLGHIFPVYMSFHGGKGLACLGGMILAFDWRVFFGLLVFAILILFVTDYLFFVPVTVSVAILPIYAFMTGRYIGALILSVGTVAIIWRHVENIQRIKNGTELHFSYLWHKDEELDRIKEHLDEEQRERFH